MNEARDVTQLVEDIIFYRDEISQTAPLLRTVAGLTYGTATLRADFIEAAVKQGFNPATAGVCWAAGRKFMQQLESEE